MAAVNVHEGKKRQEDMKPMTILELTIEEQKRYLHATGEFTQLINTIQTAVKCISYEVRKSGIVVPADDKEGNKAMKLDKKAEEILVSLLTTSKTASLIYSKLSPDPYYVDMDYQGKYVVVLDPLNGFESNEECHLPVGSIFGIYRQRDRAPNQTDFLRPGKEMVGSGYALYANVTVLVVSLGVNEGVFEFTLDPEVGEFLVTDSLLKMPSRGKVYSINEGMSTLWDAAVSEYVQKKKDPRLGRPYEYRNIGSYLADVHRTLKIGGIYMVPANSNEPKGNLSLVFECGPIAFLIREAGGLACCGITPTLEMVPESWFQMVPLFLGSQEDVADLLELITVLKATQLSENMVALEDINSLFN